MKRLKFAPLGRLRDIARKVISPKVTIVQNLTVIGTVLITSENTKIVNIANAD